MAEAPKRVALLARPGPACDNLQSALRQAGAEIVLVADPTAGDSAAVAAAAPQAVLVALEPSVEDALDGFDQILLDPSMLVIYDEVAVAAKREGWDAARWVRHLAAKLGGHHDVLPPGAGSDDDVVAPAPVTPAPVTATPAAPIELTLEAVEPSVNEGDSLQLEEAGSGVDLGDLTDEMKALLSAEPVEDRAPSPVSEVAPPPVIEWDAPSPPAPEPVEEMAPTRAPATPAPAFASAPTISFSADNLSLVEADVGHSATGSTGSSSLGGSSQQQGAVLVLAGIGGPDAVRQFLAAVPEGFARPVVVRQRLDGGRHDRLVQQMQRATALPVVLAEAGTALQAGHIYILPDGMTTEPRGNASVFNATEAPVPLLAGLPAGDSAILLLSGSDPAAVPEAIVAASQGAVVAGQALEDCFDSAATAALIAAGGEASAPADFAKRLSTHWVSLSLSMDSQA